MLHFKISPTLLLYNITELRYIKLNFIFNENQIQNQLPTEY